jgi:hypothetical protein
LAEGLNNSRHIFDFWIMRSLMSNLFSGIRT